MTPTGIELISATAERVNAFRNPAHPGAAKSDAFDPDSTTADPRLATIVAAGPVLSEVVKDALSQYVRDAANTTASGEGGRPIRPNPGPTYRLDIPAWTPALASALLHAHPAEAARLQQHDRETVTHFARLQDVPRAAGPRQVQVKLHGWPRGCLPATDAPLRSLLDALVSAGLLVGDSPRWCELAGVRYVRSAERRTVVTLEELSDAEAASSG
jgi:hypothetical protein